MKTFYLLLIATALLTLLINRRHLDKRLHLFIPLLTIALLADGLRSWLGTEHPVSELFFTLYTPVEYTLQALVVCSYLKDIKQRRLVLISIPFFVGVALWIQLVMGRQGSIYEYADVLVQSPLICTWTLLYFYQLLREQSETTHRGNPMFIISIAHLLFFSAGFFSYAFRNVFPDTDYGSIIKGIGRASNLLLYALYLVAFAIPRLKQK
jgi:hypothetical protein